MSARSQAGLLIALLALLACGKSVEDQVRDEVRSFGGAELEKDLVLIDDLQAQGDHAIAQLTLKTAVKLRKLEGRWVIEEVRIGDRRWEKADHLLALLQERRSETARHDLEEVRQGIEAYRLKESRLPEAADYEALVDLLSPLYLGRVIRLDPWSRSFRYRLSGPSFDLRSAGPDGEFDTVDDIVGEGR